MAEENLNTRSLIRRELYSEAGEDANSQRTSSQPAEKSRRESNRLSFADSTLKYIWQYSERHGFNPEDVNKRVERRRERFQESSGPIMDQPAIRQTMENRESKRQSAIRNSILQLNESVASPRPFLRTASPLLEGAHTPGPLLHDNLPLHHKQRSDGVNMSSTEASASYSTEAMLPESLTPGPNLSLLTGINSTRDTSMALNFSQIGTLPIPPESLTPGRNLSLLTGINSTRDTSMALNLSQASIGEFSVQPEAEMPDSSAIEIPVLSETADLTEISMLMDRDPNIADCPGLFAEFFHCFTSHPDVSQVFDLVNEYEKACRDQVSKLELIARRTIPGKNKFSKIVDMIGMITQESYTWRLIGALFRDRLKAAELQNDTLNPNYTGSNWSEQKIIDILYERDSTSRQNQIIVDWLEKNAEDDLRRYLDSQNLGYYTESVSWENTLHQLQQDKMSGIPGRNIVTEMDPDAPIRQKNPLADLDQADEARFFKHLFTYIRAGRISEAIELCVKCGQAWRGATLEGWRLYHDPNMEEGHLNGEVCSIIGNPQRDIWKTMTWNLSQCECYHIYERAVYAALCGNLQQLIKVCDCWDDCLWAYYKVMVDVRVEQELRDNYHRTDRSMESLPSIYWDQMLSPKKIFEELQAHPNQSMRNQAVNPVNIIKTLTILNDIEGLLEKMHDWLKDPHLPSHLLRLMAHLVLFLRTVLTDLNEEICIDILHCYVKHLIDDKQTLLVATYTATLPYDMQVDTYAFFLEGIHGQNYRLQCLELAKSAGLDIPSITKKVVENIRGKDDFRVDIALSAALEAVTSEEDKKKIEAIEWLVFDPSQRAEALKQSNAIIRCFLATHKLVAAREVFEKIPSDSVAVLHKEYQRRGESGPLPDVDSNAIREYLCIKVYLDAHEAFNSWFEHFHHGEPVKPVQGIHGNFTDTVAYEENRKEYEVDIMRWKDTLNKLTKTVCDKIYNVLMFPDGGWMIDPVQAEIPDASRSHQMEVLRQLCIPRLTYLLHSVLYNTQQYKQCLKVADVIASEQHQLYKAFRKDEYKKFLSLMRDASLKLLENNMDPMGYEVL